MLSLCKVSIFFKFVTDLPVNLDQVHGQSTINQDFWFLLISIWSHPTQGSQDRAKSIQKRELRCTFIFWIANKALPAHTDFPYGIMS